MEQANQETGESRLPVPIAAPDQAALDIIRTETVLSKLPIHNLAKKGRVDIRILKTTPAGAIELKWEVSYNERYGQARQLAYKLDTIIVNQKIDEADRPLPKILRLGSLNEICAELGLVTDAGKNAKDIKRAFLQNASAFITAKFNYKATDKNERLLEAGFTRYNIIFTGEKLPDGRKADAVYIIFNDPFWEVLNNAPARPLDRGYMKQLPPAAQRFYEIISYKIFSALKNKHPYAKLAYSEYCTFSAAQRSLDWEFVRPQMYQVHQPHVQSGYLVKPIRHEATTDGEGNLDWNFYYIPGPRARAEFNVANPGQKLKITDAQPAGAGDTPPPKRHRKVDPQRKLNFNEEPKQLAVTAEIETELSNRGVMLNASLRKTLAALPADFPVLDLLEYGDFQKAHWRGPLENAAGIYVSLIQDKKPPPATFEPKAKRLAREEAERRREEERRQRVELETEYEWYRNEEIDRFIAALDAAQVKAAYDAAWKQNREQYRSMPGHLIDRFAEQQSRRELGKRAPLMTIEEFTVRRQEGTLPATAEAPVMDPPNASASADTEEQGSDPPFLLKPVAAFAAAEIAPEQIVLQPNSENSQNVTVHSPAAAQEIAADPQPESATRNEGDESATTGAPAAQEPGPEASPANAGAATAAPDPPQPGHAGGGPIEPHLL